MGSEVDTIAALATAPGRGSIGVVRISGDKVPSIAVSMLGKLPAPRCAELLTFLDADGHSLDQGVALYFAAPNSFTGEEVLELQGHGGSVVMDLLLQRALALGARLALPGEFSQRAFLNDKLDLVQAEAVADLIDASSEQAARAAMRSLQGAFSEVIEQLLVQLIALRVQLEAFFDFPDEEVDDVSGSLLQQLLDLKQQLQTVLLTAEQGEVLQQGLSIAIVGAPNAGKSSLLNRLSGHETAIVTAVPGTTRDVLRVQINVQGVPFQIIDTAGLRASGDEVEQEGIRRALTEIQNADYVLWIRDASAEESHETLASTYPELQARSYTVIWNKSDLVAKPKQQEKERCAQLSLSAKTGAGIDRLLGHLQHLAGMQVETGVYSARRRHVQALQTVQQHLQVACTVLQAHKAHELVAEELRCAQQALAEVTGAFSTEDLLGQIFSTFCIGK